MISIIVPVYNAGEYIEECIVSIQEQTLSDWELILVDNGSVDKSLAICEGKAEEDSRIRVLHQEVNTGVSAARNYGMSEAGGEYITFVDADDRLKPDCLKVLLELSKKHGAKMVICGFDRWVDRENSRTRHSMDDEKNRAPVSLNYSLEEYLEHCLLNQNTHCWGVLYEKELLDGLEFPEGMTIGEDVLFLIEAAFKTEVITVTDYSGYQ